MTTEARKAYLKSYYLANKEKLKERAAQYRKENADKLKDYFKENYLKNKDKKIQQAKEYRCNNKEKVRETKKIYKALNKERLSQKWKEWVDANRDLVNERNKRWRIKNPAKCLTYVRNRQAAKMQRTPNWLTTEDFHLIELIYAEAKNMEVETGIKHHVDHIIPLRGKNVSGLHVPANLQIISATDNVRKGNRYQVNA